MKIATELSQLQRAKHTVYILDEPTTGLHLADIERLLQALNQLVGAAPEKVAACKASHTGRFLKRRLQ